MSDTATAINEFDATIKARTVKGLGDHVKILAQIKKIKEMNPSSYEEDKLKIFFTERGKALSILIDNYIIARLSKQFPMLDNELFKLKRYLYLQNNKLVEDKTVSIKEMPSEQVEVSLFVHCDSGLKTETLCKQSKTVTTMHGARKVKTTNITAVVPSVPVDVLEQGRKAVAFYYNIIADVYSDNATSDLFQPKNHPRLETLWIPTVNSLDVKVDMKNIPDPVRKDPALLLHAHGSYYIVGLWDIAEEEPFDVLLREFSVGQAKFPTK